MIKKLCLRLTVVLLMVLFAGGCTAVSPEYFEELSEEELTELRRNAKVLALQGKAVPEHLQGVFAELAAHERILYDGHKSGKATFRWEIYEVPKNANRLTQKDINPYWVIVYAIGDLRDPEWKLIHAREDDTLSLPTEKSSSQGSGNVQPNRSPVRYTRR